MEESHPKGSRTFECSKNQSFVFNANGFLILPLQVCFWWLRDFLKSTKQNNYMHNSDRCQQADAFKLLLLLSELLGIISYYNWSQSQRLLILILDRFSSSFSLDYPGLETQRVMQNLV